MAVIENEYTLNLVPALQAPLTIHCSQNDGALVYIEFNILNGTDTYTIPDDTSVLLTGTKANGEVFTYTCAYSGSVVKVNLAEDMTDYPGIVVCDILFISSDEDRLGTANFVIWVERAPLEDSDFSSSDIAQTFIDYVNSARYYDQISQSYAVGSTGIRDDENIDNAKYYADLAQSYVGAPLTANSSADFLDTDKIYVYTGSESGYTYGYWYYYDGNDWQIGAEYLTNGADAIYKNRVISTTTDISI